MSISTKRRINIFTAPLRALYASVAIVWWEILTLGVLPNVRLCWRYLYDIFQLNTEEEDFPSEII